MNWKQRAEAAARVVAGLALIGLIAAGAYALLSRVFELGGVTTMAVSPVDLVRADQGWTEDVSLRHRHQSQGTKILPLSWFRALEQPVFTPLPVALYGRREYLERFGFLYDDSERRTDDELPIGFAIEPGFVAPYINPPIKTPTEVVGLTCAACHTGRLDVKGADGRLKGVLIEGGSAMINIASFQEATGLALGYTNFFPTRFNRFARRVLKADLPYNHPLKAQLRDDLKTFINTGQTAKNYLKDHKLNPIDSGYARTDALGLIGNRVFSAVQAENNVVTDAPVNFPHIWDTAWFDWVQYNASIRMPMARNIGEALGVGAVVNLDPNKGKLYDSTVNVKGLHLMESWLGGKNPFEGLQPPKWDPKVMGEVVTARAAAGKTLYKAHCAGCHLPPRDELKLDLASETPAHFVSDPWARKRFLKLKLIDLYEIGTDPNQVLNFYRRVAVMPKAPGGGKYDHTAAVLRDTIPAKVGLFLLTSLIRRDKYESLGLLTPGDPDTVKDLERLKEFDRYRTLDPKLIVGDQKSLLKNFEIDTVILATLGYKARPLDGVWATPPFLHNGSVPNLYQLLLPVARRDVTFHLGSKRFDPTRVGYETRQVRGSFQMDTTLPGNRNTGHEFRDMTVEELETAQGLTPDETKTADVRWSRVLAIGLDTYRGLTAGERRDRVRRASLDARKLPHYVPARGVIGVEFTDDERWQILEYLKTL